MDDTTGITIDTKTATDKISSAVEKATSFSRGNLETIMKSGQIWAAGCQDLSKTMAATMQTNIQRNMETMKALASIRSMKDMMDLRGSLMAISFEQMFAEAGKLTDASMKLAHEAMAPITDRMVHASEMLKQ